MRFFFVSLCVVIAIGIFGATTGTALALEPGGLVTCDGVAFAKGENAHLVACDFCKFMAMVEKVTQYLVGILILVATIMLAVTGIQMAYVASAGSDARQILKDRLTNIVIGFFLIIAAWTIVDTLLKALVSDAGIRDNWRTPISELCFSPIVPGDSKINLPKIDMVEVEKFAGDHGEGSSGEGPITGGGNNCSGTADSAVVSIPGENPRFKLLPSAANNYASMRAAAAADGITLKLSSAWRSQATQEEIWDRKNCNTVSCSGRVAKPCSKGGNGSNHNGGVAVDISGSVRGSDIYNWLKANGGRFGFYNNLGPDDPYHWSPSGR